MGPADDFLAWSDYGTWILWHHRGTNPESIVQIPRSFKLDWSNANPDQESDSDDEEEYFSAWIQWQIFKHKRTAEATPFRLSEGPLYNESIAKKSGYLQFWTMVAALDFKIHDNVENLELYDGDRDICGSILLDTPSENLQTDRLFEIILLSKYSAERHIDMEYMWKKNMNDRHDGIGNPIQKKRKFEEGKLNIMLIGWSEGIAERLGIGTIWTESVNYLKKPGLIWKEIVLG